MTPEPWQGRSLTSGELRALGRAEAAQTWSPSTKPVPVKDVKLTLSVDDTTWNK